MLQKLGCCLQIEVGIVMVNKSRTVLMLGRTLGLSELTHGKKANTEGNKS